MTSTQEIKKLAIEQLVIAIRDKSYAYSKDAHEPDYRVDGAIKTSDGVVITVTDYNSYDVSQGENVFRIKVEVEQL